MFTGDETPITTLKRRVGRMRIESDSSSSEYEEEEEQIGVPNCDVEIPTSMSRCYPKSCYLFMELITMSGSL